MTNTGIVRRVDMLGRVVIPKEIRNTFKIDFGDPMEIYTENGEIVLKKYSPIPNEEKTMERVAEILAKMTDHSVLICDKNSFIATNGEYAEDAKGKKISVEVENVIKTNDTLLLNFSSGVQSLSLYDGENSCRNQLFVPIRANGDCAGLIILCNGENDRGINPSEVRLATLGAEFISANS